MAYYIDKNKLTYHIILSIGKGNLTKEAEDMIYLLLLNIFKKFEYRIKDYDDRLDIFQYGALHLYSGAWKKYNKDKFDDAFVYLSEVCKRAFAQGFNTIKQKKTGKSGYYPKFLSIDQALEGKGMII